MEARYLVTGIQETAFAAGKMAFVSGPRQSGKTTLGRILLAGRQAGRYANWDDVEIRRLWTKDPKLLAPAVQTSRALLVLDEIHKARLWKRAVFPNPSWAPAKDACDSGVVTASNR